MKIYILDVEFCKKKVKEILKLKEYEVIKNNKNRRPKNLWTQNAEGEQIVYYRANDELDEAVFVARTIDELSRSQNFLHKDFAVLYRTNAQSRTIEEALLKSNIPYTMVGGTKFYSRKEIRDIIAYLNLIANLSDNISFERIINEPKRGIGPGTVEKIRDFANEGVQVNLAVSLHAPNNELRSSIMKINRAFPIEKLFAAIEYYIETTNRRVTFEYIMLNEVNDGVEQALELAELLKNIKKLSYVNLIPYNPVSEHD